MARSFRSAASRCASADFTPFPLSAFGAMAEVVGEIDGVGGAGGNGGRSAALFQLREEGGAAEICENGVTTSEMGELPLFPLLIKREGADVSSFRIKKPPTISPMTPHSTRAVGGGRGGYGVIYGVTQAACARALFWAWPNSARHRVWPRPGGSCRCTRVGVP